MTDRDQRLLADFVRNAARGMPLAEGNRLLAEGLIFLKMGYRPDELSIISYPGSRPEMTLTCLVKQEGKP